MLANTEWIESLPKTEPKTEQKFSVLLGEAKTPEQREAVYRLRYKVYIEEMARGCKADHENKKIEDHLDRTGLLTTAHLNGELVGTCRANFSSSSDFEHRELYEFDKFEAAFPNAVMFTTKLMILPEMRKSSLFLRICKQIYEAGLKRGAFVMIIDCNDHLVKPFSTLGFRAYKEKFAHPEYGLVNPMVLYNYDAKFLQEIRSPFFPILKKHIDSVSKLSFKENINEL